jgi:hypothetical protein
VDFRYRMIDGDVTYTGRELRSGWVERQTGLEGDAAAVFFGPCDVATEDLVDLEDRSAGAVIVAKRMLHVVAEHPGCDIATAVLRQRLMVCLLCEVLAGRGVALRRSGDDVFAGDDKLTVSIAAPAPASSLIHLGVNVDPEGAPVPAVGLSRLGLEEDDVARALMERYREELSGAAHAATKVRSVE